jgi:hypothetical protein
MFLLHDYPFSHPIKEMFTKIWSENLKGRDHSEVRRRWEYIIRMDLLHLHLDRFQWWAVVNTVMNVQGPCSV